MTVTPGRHIPLNPANQLRIGGDVDVMAGLSVGGDFSLTGSQYFDGDNSNLNPKLPSYWVVNLRASYALSDNWQLFALVNNVFNRHDATYGTFFETGDTDGLFAKNLSDPRTETLEQPVSAQLGLKVKF